MTSTILVGDCRQTLKQLPDQSVHCVITSPPYWGLRSYKGDPGMIGLEPTWGEHVDNLLAVFEEVRRVLRDDGTLWLNYGDAYSGSPPRAAFGDQGDNSVIEKDRTEKNLGNLKPKNLMLMPVRFAIAMQDAGWILRKKIIWAKPNPVPESAKDRPISSYEELFLFSKQGKYFYDYVAVRETAKTNKQPGIGKQHAQERDRNESQEDMTVNPTRNLRDVWHIPTESFKGAHFATFPTKLVEPCIKAGTSEQGVCAVVGDPYVRQSKSTAAREYKEPAYRKRSPTKEIQGIRDRTRDYVNIETTGWQPSCGAPYVRQVDISGGTIGKGWHDHDDDLGKGQSGAKLGDYNIKTKGWQPSCECAGEKTKAVVLDPFGGSGTVSIVAERLNRDSIICEISPEYAEIARQRIESESLPMFPTTIKVINE